MHQERFIEVIQVKHPAIDQVFHRRQVLRVGFIVAYVERVIVHRGSMGIGEIHALRKFS